MKAKKSERKTKRAPMPSTKTPPPQSASRKQRKTLPPRVCAAISIDETLYLKALAKAGMSHDNNFSRYVRTLVKKDLGMPN